jgi:hypothetical protein
VVPAEQSSFTAHRSIAGNLAGDRCDQHCVASPAVAQPEIALLKIEEMPVDWALSSTNGVSNLTKNTQFERENGKSLRRILEIFPLFGDARRRLARSALRGVGRSKATEISSQKSADACLRFGGKAEVARTSHDVGD